MPLKSTIFQVYRSKLQPVNEEARRWLVHVQSQLLRGNEPSIALPGNIGKQSDKTESSMNKKPLLIILFKELILDFGEKYKFNSCTPSCMDEFKLRNQKFNTEIA